MVASSAESSMIDTNSEEYARRLVKRLKVAIEAGKGVKLVTPSFGSLIVLSVKYSNTYWLRGQGYPHGVIVASVVTGEYQGQATGAHYNAKPDDRFIDGDGNEIVADRN